MYYFCFMMMVTIPGTRVHLHPPPLKKVSINNITSPESGDSFKIEITYLGLKDEATIWLQVYRYIDFILK